MPDNPPRRFTALAEKALRLARRQADCIGNNYIGAGHLTLGLLALNDGGAVKTIQKLGLDLEQVRRRVEQRTGPGLAVTEKFTYTPRVQMILKLAAEEAAQMGAAEQVGTEHLLLGLLREGDSLPAQVLAKDFGLNPALVRQGLLRDSPKAARP